MVALDDGSGTGAGLDDVGVDGALGQKVHGADLPGLLLEDPDELRADDLPLALRVRLPGQLQKEAGLCVHPDEVDVPGAEGLLHLISLVLAHEAVVHEHAGELAAHRLRQKGGAHRGVHPAGEGQQHPAAAHLLPDGGNGGVLIVLHGPQTLGAADLIEEVMDHVHPVLRVVHLRVELDAVEAPVLVGDGHVGAGGGVGRQGKALGHPGHIVPVAHPGDAPLRQALEQAAGGIIEGLRLAVLPGGVLLGSGDGPAQGLGHELAAIADAQNGHPQPEDLRIHVGGLLVVDAVGSAGEDDPHGVKGPDLREGEGVGLHLTVDMALPDAPGDELVILAAEIQHQNRLTGQRASLLFDDLVRGPSPGFFTPRPGRRCRSRRRSR